MSQLLKEVDADGINFDTLESVPPGFREASDAIGHPLALEPQFQPRDASLAWTNLSWNDWVAWEGKPYPFIPMVSKNKWMEPRHTVNVTDRFTRDKTDSLQHAFFNGQGYATLENLWGFWYENNPRDAEAILRFTRIERAMADYLLQSGLGTACSHSCRQACSPAVSRRPKERCGRSSTVTNTMSLDLRSRCRIGPACTTTICGTGRN